MRPQPGTAAFVVGRMRRAVPAAGRGVVAACRRRPPHAASNRVNGPLEAPADRTCRRVSFCSAADGGKGAGGVAGGLASTTALICTGGPVTLSGTPADAARVGGDARPAGEAAP